MGGNMSAYFNFTKRPMTNGFFENKSRYNFIVILLIVVILIVLQHLDLLIWI